MKTYSIFWGAFLVFFLLLFILPYQFIPSTLGSTVLTVTSFLFGIIAGFYIVVTTTDYNSVKNILAIETAGWIQLYRMVQKYEPSSAERLSALIDAYIRRNLDFEIIEYAKKTIPEYDAIVEEIGNLPFKTDLSSVYQVICGTMTTIETARQQMIVLSTKNLSQFQWAILLTLATLFIVSLYGIRDGLVFLNIVALTASSAAVLVLLLIRDLDLYIWNERTFGFDIFENVFRAIGQVPYYPGESLEQGRIEPSEKEYRVGTLSEKEGDSRRIEVRMGA